MTGNAIPATARRWGIKGMAVFMLSLGVTASALAATPVRKVEITRFAFGPLEITVAPGTQVTWTNHDQVPHTVTSKEKGGELSSQALDTDDTYSHTFTHAGDYPYYCTVHPFMTGVVHVHE